MRYLVKRDDFIRTAKSVETKSDFMLERAMTNQIFESGTGGPFYNETAWHDSLLGRLIDHIIRKAKIAMNLMRIKPLIRRLRMQFDQMAAEGTIASFDSEDRSDAQRLMLSKLYSELINLIDKDGNVGEIKRVTKESIDVTVDLIPKFEEKMRPGLTTAKDELEKFYEWLQKFEDNEGSEPSVDEDEVEEVDDTKSRIVNFGHLYNIMLIYQGIKREESLYRQQQQANKQGASGSQGVSGSQGTSGVPGGVNVAGQTVRQNTSRLHSYDRFMSINEEEGVAKTAGKIVGAVVKFFRGGKDEKKPDPQTVKLLEALKPLWDLFNTDKGVLEKDSELHKFLNNPETDKLTYNKYKSNIDRIYTAVRGTGVVKEGVHDLLGKSDQIGKMVAKIYEVTSTKPNGDFPEYPGAIGEVWSEFCDEIKKFNATMKAAVPAQAQKSGLKEGDYATFKSSQTGNPITKQIVRIEGNKAVFKDQKGQEFSINTQNLTPADKPTQESLTNMLFEAEGDPATTDTGGENTPEQNTPEQTSDAQPALIETGTTSERIKDFFDKRCKTVRSYVLDKTEIDKISANLNKVADAKNFVIDGFDPVIQIVRLFNRAYKLYTTETISKRKDGKVAPSVYNEYTSFGGRSSGGDLNGWSGPYRNVRIFNIWEDAVLEIIANKKYEFIFSKKTKLRLPLVSDPQKPEDYEYRNEAGAKLRDFILDILDGEELYKSGSEKGSQKKFLEKYFGPVSSSDTGSTTLEEDDPQKIGEIAKKIDESARNIDFQEIKPKSPWPANTFFVCEVRFQDEKGNEKSGIRYFRILTEKSVMFSKTFFYFERMIGENANEDPLDGRKFKVEKGRLRGDKLENRIKPDKGEPWQMCYAATRYNLDMLFRAGQKISIDYVEGGDYRNKKNEKFKVEKVLWLSEKEEKELKPFTLRVDKDKMAKIVDKINAGGRVKLAKDAVNHINQASTTSINVVNDEN